jgi:outer membrane protein assembly factor BamE
MARDGGFPARAANRGVFRYDARNTPKAQAARDARIMQNLPLSLPSRRLAGAVLAIGLAVLASGCVYRIDIQQGNFLENKEIDQITVGMTRSQVRYLLGTPIVGNAFQNSRWDYVYFLKHGRTDKTDQRHFTVYFEDDKVTRIERRISGDTANATASTATPK